MMSWCHLQLEEQASHRNVSYIPALRRTMFGKLSALTFWRLRVGDPMRRGRPTALTCRSAVLMHRCCGAPSAIYKI